MEPRATRALVNPASFTSGSPVRNMITCGDGQALSRMHLAGNRIRVLGLILGLFAATLFACGSAQAASPWGKLNHFSLPLGSEPGHIVLSANLSPEFAAGTDGSYYILDSPKEDEFRLQRFTGTKAEASISFSPPLTKAEKEGREGAGHEAIGATLAVDPSRNRVYVLTHYERKSQSPAELKEEEKTGKPVFPLDSAMNAAGALYAFEYSGTLTSAAERENEKGEKEPGPVLSRTAFASQGEVPKEALLDPRGMAVDPSTGDLVVAGNQDKESNEAVRGGAQKQCRAAAQFVAIEATPKVKAKLGRRYVDGEATILKANAQELGCGEAEPEEAEEKAPLAPAFAPDGSLLVLYDEEAQGIGEIWEMAPPQTLGQVHEEVLATPAKLFSSEALENVLQVETAAEQGDGMMSLVSESATDGTIYLDEQGRGGLENYISGESAPLVLHYHRASGGKPALSEVGWTAGGRFSFHGGPEPCTLRKPEVGSAELAGLGSGKYLAFTTYVEGEGPSNEIKVPRAEVVEFGEGGSTTGCPVPAVTTPVQSFAGKETHTLPASSEKITVSSYLNRIEGGVVKSPALANAKSVEWTIKFTGPAGEHEEKHLPTVEYPLGGEDPLKLSFAFEHAGTYEITDVVHTDALAGEVVHPAIPDTVTVFGKELSVKFAGPPEPKSVRAHEEAAKFTATVEDPTVEKGVKIKLATVTWQLGEEAPVVESEKEVENGVKGNLTLTHALGRCKTPNCKVEVSVKEAGEKGLAGHSEQTEITVTESKAEEAARHAKEAEEAAQHAKEAKEAEEAAQHAKEAEEAQHAKEAQEAAQHAKEAQEAAQHAKEAEEARNGLLAYQVSAAAQSSISVNSSGAFTLKLTCPSGASCSGTVSLRSAKALSAGKGKHKSILTFASGPFSLSGGQTKSITLHLSAAARALLAKSHSLAARLTLVANGPHGQQPQGPRNLTLVLVVKKKH